MPLTEGQVQLRSLVMGAGTSYRFTRPFNPFGRSNRADNAGKRPWRDGSWSGLELANEAVVPMRMVTLGDETQFLGLHQAFAAAFAPSDVDLDLTFVISGTQFLMRGRPRLLDPEPRHLDGTCYYQAAFIALDPLIYSSTLHSVGLVLPVVTGGLTLPRTLPFAINSTQVSGTAAISNVGTAPAGLTLRIDGPVTEPRIALQRGSTVETLRFALTLTTGQWIDVDTKARTVYMNGTASRRGQTYGDWPLLTPGTSDVSFAAATYDASAACTVSWRDAWR